MFAAAETEEEPVSNLMAQALNDFRVPPNPMAKGGQGEATAVAAGMGKDTFKLSVLGANKGVDPSCTFSLVEFQNNVSFLVDGALTYLT